MSKIIPHSIIAKCERYADEEQRTIWLTHRANGCINIRSPKGEDHHLELISRADIIAYCTPSGEWWCLPDWQLAPPKTLLF